MLTLGRSPGVRQGLAAGCLARYVSFVLPRLVIGVTVRHRVVIVGSSVGGVRTARALRTEGFTGRITLVGEEPELPYDRPPLSKQVLTGAWPAERAGLLTAQAAADAGVELRLGEAARSLDTEARRVHLADGEVLP